MLYVVYIYSKYNICQVFWQTDIYQWRQHFFRWHFILQDNMFIGRESELIIYIGEDNIFLRHLCSTKHQSSLSYLVMEIQLTFVHIFLQYLKHMVYKSNTEKYRKRGQQICLRKESFIFFCPSKTLYNHKNHKLKKNKS